MQKMCNKHVRWSLRLCSGVGCLHCEGCVRWLFWARGWFPAAVFVLVCVLSLTHLVQSLKGSGVPRRQCEHHAEMCVRHANVHQTGARPSGMPMSMGHEPVCHACKYASGIFVHRTPGTILEGQRCAQAAVGPQHLQTEGLPQQVLKQVGRHLAQVQGAGRGAQQQRQRMQVRCHACGGAAGHPNRPSAAALLVWPCAASLSPPSAAHGPNRS